MTPLLAVTETAPGTMTGYWVTVGAILLLLGYWQGIKSLKRRAQRGNRGGHVFVCCSQHCAGLIQKIAVVIGRHQSIGQRFRLRGQR